MAENQNPVSDNVAIEREKQKTKRYMLFIGAFVSISLVGIFLVLNKAGSGGTGKIDLDLSKGKISFQVDKPIVKQAKQPTKGYNAQKGEVEYTTGKIDREFIREFESENISISADSFTGENYINTELGFVLSVLNPSRWSVNYNPEGKYDSYYPVNTIVADDEVKSYLNINIDELNPGEDFLESIESGLYELIASGMLTGMPDISYDEESETIFLSYFNEATLGATYQKIVKEGQNVYMATANYNTQLSNPDRVDELIEMVASFTLISS